MRHIRLHTERYVFASQFVKDKVVLDVACGSGYGSNHMMKKGAYMVVGGDVSKEAIRDAIRFYRGERAYYLILDAQRLPFKNNSFDIVVCFETIEHLHRYEDFIKEIKRILKTNGVFICSTPNKAAHTKRSPYHVHEFTIDEFRSLLEKYFKDVTLYGYYPLLKKDQLKGNVESLISMCLAHGKEAQFNLFCLRNVIIPKRRQK